MSGFDSKKTEYMLLHMIADSGHPIGAGFLADMLTSEGEEAASEATIGRYLRKLEKQGLLRSEKYNGRSRGRVITEDGARRIRELEIEHRQEKAMQDTMEIFNNGFGGHLRNLLLTREIVEPEAAALAAQKACEEAWLCLRAAGIRAAAASDDRPRGLRFPSPGGAPGAPGHDADRPSLWGADDSLRAGDLFLRHPGRLHG